MKRERSLLKGCQKRIVQIKSMPSELFEEAYFILKPSGEKAAEDDIVKEAERLLKESLFQKKEKTFRVSWEDILVFLAGAALAVVIFCISGLFS